MNIKPLPRGLLARATPIATFFIMLFVGIVFYDTKFANISDDVMIDTEHVVRGWNNTNGLVVVYERGFTIKRTADGEVQRVVKCPPEEGDQWYFDGPSIRRTFVKGYYPPAKRPLQFPTKVPVGTRCALEVWGVWKATFAVSSTRFLLDKMEFVVEERPRETE